MYTFHFHFSGPVAHELPRPPLPLPRCAGYLPVLCGKLQADKAKVEAARLQCRTAFEALDGEYRDTLIRIEAQIQLTMQLSNLAQQRSHRDAGDADVDADNVDDAGDDNVDDDDVDMIN